MMNLEEALERYRDYLLFQDALSDLSIQAYLSDLSQFESFAYRKNLKKLSDIQASLLKEYLSSLVVQGLAPRSRARKISALKKFLSFLRREKCLVADFSYLLTSPKKPAALPNFLNEEEIQKILASFNALDRENNTKTLRHTGIQI